MSEPVGIIYPPPDLKGIVDKMAKYVAKNGGAFEEKIIREHRGNPKFSFLFSDDPFNAYYKHKVREIRQSLLNELESAEQTSQLERHDGDTNNNQDHQRTTERDGDKETEQVTDDGSSRLKPADGSNDHEGQHSDEQEGAELDGRDAGNHKTRSKLDDYIQEMTMKIEEPPPLNHLATSAPSLTRIDCDIIKLTSQYIATYGRSFLLELVSREQTNSQFDFLRPQHGQFSYMTNLIMQYALIRNPPLDILEQIQKDATSQKNLLERIKMRAEWTRMLEIEKRKKEEAEEKERQLYSQIDWHDFVIVETIDFSPDEVARIAPTTADLVGTRLLMQQRCEDQVIPEEMDIDMDMDSDQEEADNDDNFDTKDNFAVPVPPDAANIVIRKDYDPKAARSNSEADNYFVSPITNERVPVDKIHEHVRYNLADPRYLEKKDQMLQEKMNEEAVFASGSQIQDSLKNLAERRTDIFGMNDEEAAIGRRIGEEEQSTKANEDKIIWDGHKSSLKKRKQN